MTVARRSAVRGRLIRTWLALARIGPGQTIFYLVQVESRSGSYNAQSARARGPDRARNPRDGRAAHDSRRWDLPPPGERCGPPRRGRDPARNVGRAPPLSPPG